jgi:hypothetical protein
MTFTSFLTRLLFLAALMFGLLFSVQTQRFGIENLFVFAIGFLAMSALFVRLNEGANAAFPIPGGWSGRAAIVVLVLLRLQILITLVEHDHYIAGFLVAIVTLMHWSAFIDVLKAERELKELMAETSGIAFAPPLARTDSGTTTLEKLSEPNNRVGFKATYGGTSLAQP